MGVVSAMKNSEIEQPNTRQSTRMTLPDGACL